MDGYLVGMLNCITLLNIVDALRIALEIYGIHQLRSGKARGGWIAIWCSFRWLRLMYSFRAFSAFGPRILPIFSAVRDTRPFFLVLVTESARACSCYSSS